MLTHHARLAASIVLMCLLSLLVAPAVAQISVSGDPGQVDPADPSTWTNGYGGIARIGIDSGKSGTVTVAGGRSIGTYYGYLGYGSGSNGTAVITGNGSTWINDADMYVGYSGTGTLRVENGGKVITRGIYKDIYLGYNVGSNGTATVTGPGSILTTSTLYMRGGRDLFIPGGTATLTVADGGTVTTEALIAAASDLRGDGTINTTHLFVDMNLVFDATHGQVLAFGTGGTLNRNVGGTGMLAVGNRGTGSLRVADGVTVSSANSYVGFCPGSNGMAIITGPGSTWSCHGSLSVGDGCSGTLTIGNGGKVTAQSVIIGSGTSALKLHVSGNGMLVVGDAVTSSGSIQGTVTLYADAFLPVGTYAPITDYAGIPNGYSPKTFGGTWSNTTKVFTVAAVTVSTSGASSILTSRERLLIIDSDTGQQVGASLGSVAVGTNFRGDLVSGTSLSALMASIPAGQGLLGAWNFTTNLTYVQALLSFDVGAGQSDLAVWHYDGTTWTAFATPDLTYGDDGIANFAVTGFGGYAVTGTVPEPAAMSLLALGGLALIRRRR